MRLISSSGKLKSSANFSSPGSGSQGGMKRLRVTAAIWRACDFASWYVSNGNGPASPGRWQDAHDLYRIGAMSRLKVTCIPAPRGDVAAGGPRGEAQCGRAD